MQRIQGPFLDTSHTKNGPLEHGNEALMEQDGVTLVKMK
jgi:hypothetical protein